MFRVEYNKLDGSQQVIASCLNHIPWTMNELGAKRVILTQGDRDDTCMGCLKNVDITVQLPVITTGSSSGS
jgi:hypothetical protein